MASFILPFQASETTTPSIILVPMGFEATCDVAVVAGDPVRFSDTIDGEVERLLNNTFNGLVVGIVSEKPTSTTCIVILIGLLSGIGSGFTKGQPVWVSPAGHTTTTRPTSGHLQILGNATSSTDIVVNLEQRKTVLT
jgi:hypothetical protein